MKYDIRNKISKIKHPLCYALSLVVLVSYFIFLVSPVSAQTATSSAKASPTPTKTPVKSAVDEQINNLKDKIASRVAQLKLVERRGILGTVTEVSQTQITLTDIKGETRFIDVDELTKFSSPSAKEAFGISDISKGTKLGTLGLYNKQTRRLLSRFVDVISLPKSVHGAVASTDSKEFVINVVSADGTITPVDIETITKTIAYDKKGDAIKSGFSKIKEGERIVVIGFEDKTDKKRVIASRVLLFPEIPANPKIKGVKVQPTATPTKETTPATSSAKKTTPTPIKR